MSEHPSGTPQETLSDLRVLIVHDWIMSWAGSERVLEQMCHVLPHADVVVGVMDARMRRFNPLCERARESWLARLPGARRHYQWLLPMEALAFRTLDTSEYDLVISSSHAFAKSVRPGRRGLHLCYCHSPPRYLWDLHDTYMARANRPRRAAMALGRAMLRALDRWSSRQVTHFVCNSRHVATQVRRIYGRGATIVPPPVEAKPSFGADRSRRRGDFVLYLGRLVPYKGVDVIVAAADVHGVRTVIAGDGPERERLQALAGERVQFLGAVSDIEAGRLLNECAAFVFCAEEDFGIAPVEANAHGAPVVAYDGGGVRETMIDGVTAELFHEITPEALAAAVLRTLARSWDENSLRANAARFGAERFRRSFAEVATAALAGERW